MKPIGVFDSGVGGLSILKALRAELPHEDFVYVADSGHAPYGERDDEHVMARARAITAHLINRYDIKALVIACNTASTIVLPDLRARFTLPFVGTVPAIKPACAASATRRVSVLGTEATVQREYTRKLIAEFANGTDVAIAPDGTIYASDPDWKNKTGQVWRVATSGEVSRVARDMGTTNGIEVSPDGKTLYVNESVQRNVWAFAIAPDGALVRKRLLKQFPDHGFDGMRCDVDGNLYLTRHGKGTVVKLTPQGEVLQEIAVLGANPTNLCFGGPDGRTVYVTEAEQRRIVQFRVDRPGLEWRRWPEPSVK